jgi:hypothetical protein
MEVAAERRYSPNIPTNIVEFAEYSFAEFAEIR